MEARKEVRKKQKEERALREKERAEREKVRGKVVSGIDRHRVGRTHSAGRGRGKEKTTGGRKEKRGFGGDVDELRRVGKTFLLGMSYDGI